MARSLLRRQITGMPLPPGMAEGDVEVLLLAYEELASNATVVMVSSDLDRLLTVTDRVGMMYRGRLVFDGPTAEAKASDDPLVRQFVHGLTEGPL